MIAKFGKRCNADAEETSPQKAINELAHILQNELIPARKNLQAAISECFDDIKCDTCQGTGEDPYPQYAMGDIWYVDCPECRGRGYFKREDFEYRD